MRHDPNGIYDLRVRLDALRLRLQYFIQLTPDDIANEQLHLLDMERQLMAQIRAEDERVAR